MLSRVADALYWMGRYLERAENLTRLLLTTEELWTELRGFNEKLADTQWSDLLAIFPGAPAPARPARAEAVALDHLSTFFGGRLNAYSVAFSLRRARENARAVREALTIEVFLSLNETYRELESHVDRTFPDLPAMRAALSTTYKGLLETAGAIEQTLSRDDGWVFLKLGESFERLYRTATVLRAKLPALISPPVETEMALAGSQWRNLLRALSSLENYRRLHGARMDEPNLIVSFLVGDAHAPRSLRFGAETVKGTLDRLADPRGLTPPARVIGRLASRLEYTDASTLAMDQTLVGFVDEVLDDLTQAHDAIEALYFRN